MRVFDLSGNGKVLLLVLCGLLLLAALAMLIRARRTKGTEKAGAPSHRTFEEVPPETVAAIVAAIAAIWDGETGFTVRRVRRISNAPAWNRAGRDEQIYSRF